MPCISAYRHKRLVAKHIAYLNDKADRVVDFTDAPIAQMKWAMRIRRKHRCL